MSNIITLTTDFGASSRYVAQMKGVLYSLAPQATVVDVTHTIHPQDIRHGAYVLADSCGWFPDRSIHVAVVDPGVGSAREILYVESNGQRFVLPDNGLITIVAQRYGLDRVLRVSAPPSVEWDTSRTFHGRDIMSPVAAALCGGTEPSTLGTVCDSWIEIPNIVPQCSADEIRATILFCDEFGNAITNLADDDVPETWRRHPLSVDLASDCQPLQARFVQFYAQAEPAETVLLVGSNLLVELAVVNGNAARQFGLTHGSRMRIRPSEPVNS